MQEEQGLMKLSERLQEFISHDIVVTTRNDVGEMNISEVVLEEIGEDYLTVLTKYNKDTQFSPPNERRFISLLHVVQIVHKVGCDKCAK
jgi:hypothetical protein